MKRTVALCSCPRLGFMDFMGASVVAFMQNRVDYMNLYGVYWAQSLAEGFRQAVEAGYDYIITTDYDSVFSADNVRRLIELMDCHPEADAIAAIQMGRFNGVLLSGMLSYDEMKSQDVVPFDTAHFGLTIFRASAFDGLQKPWFTHVPSESGDWTPGSGKVDDDIFFWRNFKASGKKLFLAPRVVIGHLEMLVLWPDQMMGETFQTMKHYREHGKPEDAWQ